MSGFFSQEGWLFTGITKIGEILLATILAVFCCIPVVTVVSSLTSFYYVMMKCVRRERSSVMKEFFGSMKRTFVRGTVTSIIIGLWIFGLVYNRAAAIADAASRGEALSELSPVLLLTDVLLFLTMFVAVWIPGVFSRFDMKLPQLLRFTGYISIRYFYLTVALLLLTAAGAFAVIKLLPVLFTFIVPGAVCFVSTFIAEIALKKEQARIFGEDLGDDNTDRWYEE